MMFKYRIGMCKVYSKHKEDRIEHRGVVKAARNNRNESVIASTNKNMNYNTSSGTAFIKP